VTKMFDSSQLDDVKRLRELRDQSSAIRREETVLRERLLDALGDDTEAITAGGAPALSIHAQVRRQVNAKRLEALHPEVYEEVVEEKTVTVMKVDLDDEKPAELFPSSLDEEPF
jgi:hypothetical protein